MSRFVLWACLGLAAVAAGCGGPDPGALETSAGKAQCRRAGSACNDGNPCTWGDTCNATGRECIGVPYSCDDGNPCTADACDGAGGCTHTPFSGACDDGDPCTIDTCSGGICSSARYSCDDSNVCTDDACNGDGTCAHTNNTASCEDGNPCTAGDTCGGGVCNPGTAQGCNDGLAGGAPTNLTATAASHDQIWLAWQDNSTNEDAWEVHRSTAGPAGTFTLFTVYPWPNITAGGNGGLQGGTEYCYRVRASRTVGGTTAYSDFSNTACAATATTTPPPPPPPNAPSGTNVTPLGSDGVIVTWIDNSDNEEWFRVEHAPASTGPWEFIGTWLSSAYTSWVSYGLPSEQQICYRVIAVNAYGASAPSNVDCTTPPATPNPLTALWSAGPAVDLTWTDNSSVEDGYQVRRRASGEPWIEIAELPPNATSYRDASVSAGGTYFYVVLARKDSGFSYASWEATPTDGTPRPPVAPWLDAPQGYYLGTIWLFWYSNPADVDGFEIERCDNEVCAEADFTLITTVPVSPSYTHSYQDVVGDWWIYTYRVRAYNEVGVSPPSNQAQGRTCIDGVDWESPCVPPLPSPP